MKTSALLTVMLLPIAGFSVSQMSDENSVRNNREMVIIIDNDGMGKYFTKIFNYDWNLSKEEKVRMDEPNYDRYVDAIAVITVFSIAFLLIYLNWGIK